jgi:hypothetical protein
MCDDFDMIKAPRNFHQSQIKHVSLIITRPITESDNTFPTTATKITVVPEIQTTAKNILLSEIIHYSKGTTDYIVLLCHCLVSDNSYFVEVVDYFFRQQLRILCCSNFIIILLILIK